MHAGVDGYQCNVSLQRTPQAKAGKPGPKKKTIHPKSREAKRQNRSMVRSDHLAKKKNAHAQISLTRRVCCAIRVLQVVCVRRWEEMYIRSI